MEKIRIINIIGPFLLNPNKIKCLVCNKICYNSYINKKCSHIFCEDCLTKIKYNKFFCPLDNNKIKKYNLYQINMNYFFNIFYCSCYIIKCNWKGKLIDYSKHLLNNHKEINEINDI